MREHCYYVYILASTFQRLYTGVTNGLMSRISQHKTGKNSGSFTAKYRIHKLVYFERFQYINDAIRREKEIKGWIRERKIALIVKQNPTWRDLSEDWGKPMEPFDERKMKPPVTY